MTGQIRSEFPCEFHCDQSVDTDEQIMGMMMIGRLIAHWHKKPHRPSRVEKWRNQKKERVGGCKELRVRYVGKRAIDKKECGDIAWKQDAKTMTTTNEAQGQNETKQKYFFTNKTEQAIQFFTTAT